MAEKKKAIFKLSQINEVMKRKVNEDLNVAVNSQDGSTSGYLNALKSSNTSSDIQKARTVTSDVNAVISGPKTTDKSPTIDVDVPAGGSADSVMTSNPEINAAISSQGAKVSVGGDGFPNEGKTYTKKQLKEMRLANIRKSGTVLTKKQLTESFFEN